MLGRRCYRDLIPKYCKWFTGKFVAARGENWRSVVGSLKVECLLVAIFEGTPRGKFCLIFVTKKLLMRVTKIICACNADNCCIISSRTTFHKNTTFHDLILYLVNSFPFPYYLFSQDLEIPFECTYPNQAEASLIQMNITNTKVIFLAPDDGSGIFDLDLNIYKVRMKGQGDYVVRRDALIYQSAWAFTFNLHSR